MDKYGTAHKAWERMIGYQPETGPYQRTLLYASVIDKSIVAFRPLTRSIMSMRTKDCMQQWFGSCRTVSRSPDLIYTGDEAIDKAHNYAIATYRFFNEQYGRDSIDDKGMTLESNVHVGYQYNNAYWDGFGVFYGDGDGQVLTYLSLEADVVAHELTHGITQYTSKLTYVDESGALNEAMSDIFAACIDRQEGATVANTWKIGEDVYTPNQAGDALRYMDNPKRAGGFDTDFYPERYIGSLDEGGVHWNSGIMNLAFYLMVTGGMHPRGKTAVTVPPIHTDFDTSLLAAAKIFYMANTACLTPMSGFYDARRCTLLHAGEHAASVEAAWAAVGIAPLDLEIGTPVTDLTAGKGQLIDFVPVDVALGASVTCVIEGDNGDADLFVSLRTWNYYERSSCQSQSFESVESFAVGPLFYPAKLFVTIRAFESFAGLTLKCTEEVAFVPLENAVTVRGRAGKQEAITTYVLRDMPPLTTLRCEFEPMTYSPEVVAEAFTENGTAYSDCYFPLESFSETSVACDLGAAKAQRNVFVSLYSFFGYSDLTFTCTLHPLTVPRIANWVPLIKEDFSTFYAGDSTYQEDYFGMEMRVNAGMTVTCLARGIKDKLYAEISVFHDDIAKSDAIVPSSCFVYGDEFKECTTKRALADTAAYVHVFTMLSYSNEPPAQTMDKLEILCGIDNPIIALQSGLPLTKQDGLPGGASALRVYRLQGVRKGETVTCRIDGGGTNAALYVRDGARPYPWSTRNACVGNNLKSCTTAPATKNTVIYAAVHAKRSYDNLSITCTRKAPTPSCKRIGAKCSAVKDCCGVNVACDGKLMSNRKCKQAVRAGGKCVRHTQCRAGHKCRNGKCIKQATRRSMMMMMML